VTGVPVIASDDSRFNLTWGIHKDDVSSISCDGDCDVIIWINTRTSNAFKDSFGPWENIGLYSSRTMFSYFTQLFTTNAQLFYNVVMCLHVHAVVKNIMAYQIRYIEDEMMILHLSFV